MAHTDDLRMLAEAPRGLLYLRDELAGWLGSFDRYNGNGADRAFFFGIIPLTHVLPIVTSKALSIGKHPRSMSTNCAN
jgi:hypothetical protein